MNLRAAGPGWLFCPADRPERFAKAAAAADVVILDLEDGVCASSKAEARLRLIHAVRELASSGAAIVVRINGAWRAALAECTEQDRSFAAAD